MDYAAAEAYLAKHRERHLGELQDFLRIPSVSALPVHRADVARGADWLAGRLRATGAAEVRIMPTDGNPVVYGAWPARAGAPTILLYGHYDVQPVDPVALWQTPPFEPAVRDGRLVARGASDDKGSLFIPLAALDAIQSVAGAPPINLKFLFEGEEETGSPNLAPFLDAHRELLRADVTVSADGGQWDADTPALALGNRGITGLQIDLRGAGTDLHSGTYGGAVANPIHALADLLAGMHNADGRVTVDGFYDAVRTVTPAERQDLARVPFDEMVFKRGLGVTEFIGEAEYTPLERTWIRPTLEVNGIWGGFQGAGTKTVLPNEAHAKITCRLVPDQDPRELRPLVDEFLRRLSPDSVEMEIIGQHQGRPYLVKPDSPFAEAAQKALVDAFGKPVAFIREGGSIPITQSFKDVLGIDTLLLGLALPDCKAHSPNESFSIENFHAGIRLNRKLLERISET